MAEPAARTRSRDGDADDVVLLSYAEFGRRFFEIAVREERVRRAVADIGGRPIDVGPIGVGPLNLVKVRANGQVGEPELTPRADEHHVAYDLAIPARLQMEIQIGLETYRFFADTRINLPVIARAIEPLQIFIDVEPPRSEDIDVRLEADGLRASVLEKLAGVEREVKRSVARFVGKEIEKSRDKRVIDVERAVTK